MDDDETPSGAGFVPDEEPPELPPDALAPVTHLPPLRPVKEPRVPPVVGFASPEAANLAAVNGALSVQFQRLDQLAKLQELSYTQMEGVMQQMTDMIQLMQQSWNQVDTLSDRLARTIAAVIKLYQLAEQEQQSESLF